MSDNLKFTARVTAEAMQHARNVLLTERALDAVAKQFTPICGKPHQGFKAIRRLVKREGNLLEIARQAHEEALFAKDAWVNQNGKASHDTRQKRTALYMQLLGNMNALDALESGINSGQVKTFSAAVDLVADSHAHTMGLAGV